MTLAEKGRARTQQRRSSTQLLDYRSRKSTQWHGRGSELYGSARTEAGSNAQLPSGVLSFDFSDSASEQGARRIECGHVSW